MERSSGEGVLGSCWSNAASVFEDTLGDKGAMCFEHSKK
jgi:hypothetical protein